MIDLHVHSTFSDGSLTPAELVEAAAGAGLKGLALTDHDTLDGLPEFLDAALRWPSVRAVPGVELSVAHEHGPLHMLGYWVHPGGPIESRLSAVRRGRDERNAELFRRLAALGVPVEPEAVAGASGGGLIARPHFAQALVARGWVASRNEAFARFLARGRPAYVDRFRYPAAEVVGAIREAGGIAALAHAGLLRCEGRHLRELIAELTDAGLGALEVWHSSHNAVTTRRLMKLALAHDLVPTGGSDFHGAMSPDIRLGRGFGSLDVPDDILDRLAARARGAP